MSELKYKVGDRITLEGEIIEIYNDDKGHFPYKIKFNSEVDWCREQDLKIIKPKPQVLPVAIEYYEFYKDKLIGFDDWFGDFFGRDFRQEFGEDRAEELQKWLYDNDFETNRERELALATLIVKGPEAVEVIKEKEYRVAIPNGDGGFVYLVKNTSADDLFFVADKNISRYCYGLTEEEIKHNHAPLWGTEWVKEEVDG